MSESSLGVFWTKLSANGLHCTNFRFNWKSDGMNSQYFLSFLNSGFLDYNRPHAHHQPVVLQCAHEAGALPCPDCCHLALGIKQTNFWYHYCFLNYLIYLITYSCTHYWSPWSTILWWIRTALLNFSEQPFHQTFIMKVGHFANNVFFANNVVFSKKGFFANNQ